MTILTSIGEQLVTVGDRSVKFRPSLLAMTRIGTPAEIVQVFAQVCGAPQPYAAWRKQQFAAACCVMIACAEDDDISWLIGHVNERFRYVRGVLPLEDIVGLATGLLRHGVVGDVKPDRPTRGDYVREFDARGIAATAMAHLGLSEQEAWQLTMTGYIGAMRAKYPPTEKDAKADPRSDAEVYDSAKAFLARVKAAKLARGQN